MWSAASPRGSTFTSSFTSSFLSVSAFGRLNSATSTDCHSDVAGCEIGAFLQLVASVVLPSSPDGTTLELEAVDPSPCATRRPATSRTALRRALFPASDATTFERRGYCLWKRSHTLREAPTDWACCGSPPRTVRVSSVTSFNSGTDCNARPCSKLSSSAFGKSTGWLVSEASWAKRFSARRATPRSNLLSVASADLVLGAPGCLWPFLPPFFPLPPVVTFASAAAHATALWLRCFLCGDTRLWQRVIPGRWKSRRRDNQLRYHAKGLRTCFILLDKGLRSQLIHATDYTRYMYKGTPIMHIRVGVFSQIWENSSQ